jgi:aspartate/methionine/tyrosine aminotransferase
MQVRALVMINPGNPTGQCLGEKELIAVGKFCVKHRIVLMADEVYQTNVYQVERPFVAMHHILTKLPQPDELELISFHSASKGNLGECGMRGGYMHVQNVHVTFKRDVYKLLSISLAPNTIGNIIVGLMVRCAFSGSILHSHACSLEFA